MKLCKDCRHSVWPDPIAALYGQGTYIEPMCGHPSEPREPVRGSLTGSCYKARGVGLLLLSDLDRLACGPDAKLFEERPPKIVGTVRSMTRDELAEIYPPRKSWIARMFGG